MYGNKDLLCDDSKTVASEQLYILNIGLIEAKIPQKPLYPRFSRAFISGLSYGRSLSRFCRLAFVSREPI